MDEKEKYVIGVDFGSDSVRAVLINSADGSCIASDVFYYPQWSKGLYCDEHKNQFRQHPKDHLEGLEATIKNVIQNSQIDSTLIKGICVDTTGSSPMPVDEFGQSLAFSEVFQHNPNAMMVLWKDHTSINEAQEINELARGWGGDDYTQYVGGIYSSEWFWAKILNIIRKDEAVKEKAFSWMEHCDYITGQLIGITSPNELKRSRCAAGHKAMWHESWGGLPSSSFLAQLDPYLSDLRGRLYEDTYTSDEVAGTLSEDWAARLGLTTDVVVAVGTFDAHAGAIGGEVEENTLVKVMGTSTCDIMISSKEQLGNTLVKGICGQVDGSVIPGFHGLEAGQSGFGDVLAWFKNLLLRPVSSLIDQSQILDIAEKEKLKTELSKKLLKQLSEDAIKIPPQDSKIVALDWINGRRTPDANQLLKGALQGLEMGSDAARVFKSLVESICFGSKKIVERFRSEGVRIDAVIGMGGVAKQSDFVMQTLADILEMPIKIAQSDQAPALGAAMYAAVAAEIYPDTQTAIKSMTNGFDKIYHPKEENALVYRSLYKAYEELGAFVENQTINKFTTVNESI
ncbi:ribulokinase [Litoribacter alkaliphilus]|uniref:Ribulokinase n=1 Tax=Litoribacter ruber TaxID=702568 RepID=A0AAP2CEB0_9BACT|nr:ribulokinase [Litoribacter alkaliphilus]MBS9522781.1 ribulokinase [Litoribacter alkaliphilus]